MGTPIKDFNEKNQMENAGHQVILGVDPGSQISGYALIKAGQRGFKLLDSGIYKPDPKFDFFKKLFMLSSFFSDFVENLSPFYLAIESLAYVKNANSFGKLAQARGAILTALQPKALKIYEYPPNLVKSTVSGYGHASKQSIKTSLGFFKIKKDFKSHDESDALAVALCHYFHRDRLLNKTSPLKPKPNFKGKGL